MYLFFIMGQSKTQNYWDICLCIEEEFQTETNSPPFIPLSLPPFLPSSVLDSDHWGI